MVWTSPGSPLSLVLATGLVVDDAIVVIENIVRKRKAGMGAYAAAEAEFTETVSTMVQGGVAVSVLQDDIETEVNVVPGGPPIDAPSDLEFLFLRLPSGEYVPLSVVASLGTIVRPSQIERQGGSLAVSVQANLGSGVDIGGAITQLETLADQILPDGMAIPAPVRRRHLRRV